MFPGRDRGKKAPAQLTGFVAAHLYLSAGDSTFSPRPCVQGPPGTRSKTTVIAEICYQVARLGWTHPNQSLANLVVDNALV